MVLEAHAEALGDIRMAVRDVCKKYDGAYWRGLDREGAYPEAFVRELTELGWLSALIPEQYGGRDVRYRGERRSGGDQLLRRRFGGVPCSDVHHGYDSAARERRTEGSLSAEHRQRGVASTGVRGDGARRRVRDDTHRDDGGSQGRSVRRERTEDVHLTGAQSDLMLLLARTTPYDELSNKTEGLSVFVVDMREAGDRLTVQPIDMTFNRHTNQLFFDDLEVPAENLIGEEGKGFRYIIDSWNVERILIASEAIGDARFFIERASTYASEPGGVRASHRSESGRAACR